MFDLRDYQKAALEDIGGQKAKETIHVDDTIVYYPDVTYVSAPVDIDFDSPDPTEPDYTDEHREARHRNSSVSMRTSLIAAAAGLLFGGASSRAMATTFNPFTFYDTINQIDYQFSSWPRTKAVELLKKGYFQQAQQTRWKTLQKRYEKKTKRAKGKVPVYPH